jgi:AbiU2
MATDFKQMGPPDILKADALERHSAEMRYFHDKLSELHHNIFFVQRIIDFPFDLFVMPSVDFFLRFALHNFLQVAILQITKLTTDSGGDARTLRHFRNFMGTAVKDEYQADYRELLKKAKFRPRIEELIGKAKDLRDKHIAHSVTPVVQVDALTFGEIREIVQELTRLFEVASFSMEYRYLTIAYDPAVRHPVGTDPRPDIERILDGIARESSVLHEPELSPVAWPHLRSALAPQMVERFNHYRRRCGLPEV